MNVTGISNGFTSADIGRADQNNKRKGTVLTVWTWRKVYHGQDEA